MAGDLLRPPVTLLRPVRVGHLPESMPGGAIYQVKLDGFRVAAFLDGGLVLQARSGRPVTGEFPEVHAALLGLADRCVLDGEIVAVRGGKFDFESLKASPAERRRRGAAVSYVAFDVLVDRGEDVTGMPLSQRWPRLLTLLEGAPPQLQPVMATFERAEAAHWMAALAPIGVEGVVAKPLASRYEPAHGWVKVRSEDTVDGDVVGVLGRGPRPMLQVRLGDGRTVTTTPLSPPQARDVAAALERAQAGAVRVELAVSTGRHGQARLVRVRLPD